MLRYMREPLYTGLKLLGRESGHLKSQKKLTTRGAIPGLLLRLLKIYA